MRRGSPRWGKVVRAARLAARPLETFLRIEASSGVVLGVAAGIALVWANSPWASFYDAWWNSPVTLRMGALCAEKSLSWIVNDVLMVIFFFVVGLEIRREIHHGELSEWRRAALPAAAALGGMLVPAGIYWCVARPPETRAGWGVPMATDIAFALGVLALLGKRVPPALRVLLLALAVIDDLGAILVIAIFYSSHIALSGLAVGAAGLLAIFALRRFGVERKLAYVPPAALTWAGIYAAGIHPTIAGVLVGLMTPVTPSTRIMHGPADEKARAAASPAEELIAALHPWVAFGIMPIFALANAGVSLTQVSLDASSGRAMLGIVLGLCVGKPLGVLVATAVALRTNLGVLPVGLGLPHRIVLGVVASIGFTMSLFVAQLAFGDAKLLAAAKLAVVIASSMGAVLAVLLGRSLMPPNVAPGAAASADEAEASTAL